MRGERSQDAGPVALTEPTLTKDDLDECEPSQTYLHGKHISFLFCMVADMIVKPLRVHPR